MNEVLITVLFKDNQIKSILGPKTSYPKTTWWDKEITILVPQSDWEAEKVTTTTIRNYMR